jgi:hypothetical protein
MAFEGEDLTAVFEGIAGQHAQLGEGIEDEALGADLIDLPEDAGNGVGEFDFRGMEDGVLRLRPEVVFGGNHLEDLEVFRVPAMRAGNLLELAAGLREGDIEGALVIADALEKELEGEGGFAGAGIAFDEVEMALRESAKEDVVEAGDAGMEAAGDRAIVRAGIMAVVGGTAGAGNCRLGVHLSALRKKGLQRRDAEGQGNSKFRCEGESRKLSGGGMPGMNLAAAEAVSGARGGGRGSGEGIEEAVKSGATDAEAAGGTHFVAVGRGEDAGNVAKNGPVEVGIFGGGVRGERSGRSSRGGGEPLQGGNIEGTDPLAGTVESGGGDDGLELADIAGPGMSGEAGERTGREAAEHFPVVKDPLPQEQGGEQRKVIAAVAQRGEEEADGGEMAGEIGAEGAGGGKTAEGLRGADDNLARSGEGKMAEAFMGRAFEEIAEEALLAGGELIDAGKVEEAAGALFPEGLGAGEKVRDEGRNERSRGRRSQAMEG